MLRSLLIGISILLNFNIHAFSVSGQAFQYGEGTEWDMAKINISPMSATHQYEKDILFELKQAEWSRTCTPVACYLDILLPLAVLAEIPWIQESSPSYGTLVWSGAETKLRGHFSKADVLAKHWSQHKLGKEMAITFASPQGLAIGKSVKIKTLKNEEVIIWEIDFALLLKKLTEFRPVP